MPGYFVVPVVVVGLILLSTLWGMIVDRRLRRAPSEWLASIYLGLFAGILGTLFVFLDRLLAHPVIGAILAALSLAAFVWMTVVLWRRVEKLDRKFWQKHQFLKR